MSQELSKITFTYYGISPTHLMDVLRLDGMELASNDIMKQNLSREMCSEFWKDLPTLMHLCAQQRSGTTWDSLEVSEGKEAPVKDDYINLSGRQRSVLKR